VKIFFSIVVVSQSVIINDEILSVSSPSNQILVFVLVYLIEYLVLVGFVVIRAETTGDA